MEITENVSKLVKPSTPTPSTLRNYNVSLFDHVSMNVPLILYYYASHKKQNGIQTNMFIDLEISLSQTLTQFYPLAGRYKRNALFIDCSDEGALYIQAKARFQLSEFLDLKKDLKHDMLQDFLPYDIHKIGEMDDPLLSVKVTTFEDGGVAIGMCISHHFADMTTICTFIDNWATRSRLVDNELELKLELKKYSPVVSSCAHLFPKADALDTKNLDATTVNNNYILRVFSFKGSAIEKLRQQVMSDENSIIRHRPSKVQLIMALLWKAFVDTNKANGQLNASLLHLPVNLRNIVAPKYFCGNFFTAANTRIEASEAINLQVFVNRLNESINKTKVKFAKVLSHPEINWDVLLEPFLEVINSDAKVYTFTSWCKFSFYTADFGWGKPVWRSIANVKVPNAVVMMDDKEGDGMEAWVHLDEKHMCELEKDPNIQAYMDA
ncbi:hypothetical protein E3N88_27912 [Mikania micrantha]|uniref:Uncharacterized protein n=1 Tax=Mikania micrantha TaxID=192012 RepID=A0A5N6MYK6_9ASTR|nr:hypothetical protein E3N88_27912 [Mikania micrantha]